MLVTSKAADNRNGFQCTEQAISFHTCVGSGLDHGTPPPLLRCDIARSHVKYLLHQTNSECGGLVNSQVDHDDKENKSLHAFNNLWQKQFAHDCLLVFSTGRSLKLYNELRVKQPQSCQTCSCQAYCSCSPLLLSASLCRLGWHTKATVCAKSTAALTHDL